MAEVYEQVAAAIADLEALAVAAADLSPNIEVSDRILDEIEEVLAELENLLNGSTWMGRVIPEIMLSLRGNE